MRRHTIANGHSDMEPSPTAHTLPTSTRSRADKPSARPGMEPSHQTHSDTTRRRNHRHATLARAEAKVTEQAEHDWNRRVMSFVVAFAWLLTIASWPAFHFVSARFGSLLGPQFSQTQFSQTLLSQRWISFAAFTALGWLAGGVAAVMLAIRQRGERRLA